MNTTDKVSAAHTPADDYGPIIDRANSRLAECMKQRDELASALRDLLELVESFDDMKLTRDIDPYKAQAIYDETLEQAQAVLAKSI